MTSERGEWSGLVCLLSPTPVSNYQLGLFVAAKCGYFGPYPVPEVPFRAIQCANLGNLDHATILSIYGYIYIYIYIYPY
jgi:hypothetical protein